MTKTILILAMAAATLMAVLTISQLTSSVNAQISQEPSPSIACLTFTKDGETIGDRICNRDANDIHIAFRGKCVLQFTADGENAGKPIKCPKGANDFSILWNEHDGEIIAVEWTKNGSFLDQERAPDGANDFHFKAGRIVLYQWTNDGHVIGEPIPAPAGANDVEFDVVVLFSGNT